MQAENSRIFSELWSAISTEVLDALIHKGSTAIFGKSYDAMKQEEHEDEKKAQKQFLRKDLNERLYEAQRIKQYGAVQPQIQSVQNQQANMLSTRGKEGNKIESKIGSETVGKDISSEVQPVINPQTSAQKPEEEKVDNYTYIPSSENIIPHPLKKGSIDTYTYIPSSENVIPKPAHQKENERKYIPSQAAADIQKTFDNSGLQEALDRAQRAEDNALKILAGNFDGMV